MLAWIWVLGAEVAEAKPCPCDETLTARVAALEEENRELLARLEALEQRPAVPPGPVGTPTPEQEQAAAELLKQASAAAEALDFAAAKAALDEIGGVYAGTRANKAAARLRDELGVIGRGEAPLEVEAWYQGSEAEVTAHEARLIVFWEAWCPHCRREIPKLEELYQANRDRLSVVGLTKLTRDVTEEAAREFIAENGVTYAIAKEDGHLSEVYGVRGIPAAVIVDRGVVVWRGHPARITDGLLDAVLAR